MRGIILAAGKGSRIADMTEGLPKGFLKIGDVRIIDHQIQSLRSLGISEIVIVTGYKSICFEEAYGKCADITLVYNPFYAHCNVLGSVWFARKWLKDGFFFLHGDTYFDPTILKDLAQSKEEIVLAVEKKRTVEEEMKVRIEDGKIVEINKTMACLSAQGEFIGIAKFNKRSVPIIIDRINYNIERLGRLNDFFEVVIQSMIDEGQSIYPLDTNKRFSIEIDFPEDYVRALQKIAES